MLSFHIKKSQINEPQYDTLVITNYWNAKATYNFENNFYFSKDIFVSFFPQTGEIEKVKDSIEM